MTDPRIAPLAAALIAAMVAIGWDKDAAREWAVARLSHPAFLAALPDDWCGHRKDFSEAILGFLWAAGLLYW